MKHTKHILIGFCLLLVAGVAVEKMRGGRVDPKTTTGVVGSGLESQTVVTQYVENLVVVGPQIDEVTILWLQDYMDGKMGLQQLQSALDHHRSSAVVKNPSTRNRLYLQRVRNR